MNEKVLVVGGAGYVGSVLVRFLLEAGYEVKIFDRLFFGDSGIRGIADKIELVVGDLRTIDSSVLDNVDTVINIAGLSNDPTAEYNPKANYEMNTLATEYLAKICKQKGIRRFVFASSCSTYHSEAGDETKDNLLTEEDILNPTTYYSRSKYDAERSLLSLIDDNFCPVILRKGTICGFSPRMRYDLVVNTFVKCALQDGILNLCHGGAMWRPLIDIRDVALAYIKCIQAEDDCIKGQIFNIAYRNYRIAELALSVRDVLSKLNINVDIELGTDNSAVRSYRVSTQKAKDLLKFEPKFSIEDSVVDIVNKVKNNEFKDFDNPKYYNIRWMKLLEETDSIIKITGTIFDLPPLIFDQDGNKIKTQKKNVVT